MRLIRHAALVALGAASFAVWAHNCPNEMKTIDAALAASPNLSKADLDEVKKLRAEGETAHKAGDHDTSMSRLELAKAKLGL